MSPLAQSGASRTTSTHQEAADDRERQTIALGSLSPSGAASRREINDSGKSGRSDRPKAALPLSRFFSLLSAVFAAVSFASIAEATIIQYEVENVGGVTWEYSYFVENDALGVDIEDFIVFFDFTIFTNLHLPTAPADWDPIVFQPDLNLPDDGAYDAYFLVQGIAPGASLGGFSVRADFLGVGTPGSQPFETYDANIVFLDEGVTVARTAAVPEPGTIVLLLLGATALAAARRRDSGGGSLDI